MMNQKTNGCIIILFVGILTYPFTLFGQHKYTLYIQPPEPIQRPVITSVTVSAENKNSIHWAQLANENIRYFNIYHDSPDADDSWINIGQVTYPGNYIFLDSFSYPIVRSYKYRISAVDGCGNEIFNTYVHKTINLNIAALNDSSSLLNWNPYEGFDVVSYKIFKGTDAKDLTLMDSVSALSTQYTVKDVLEKSVYYQIEAIGNIATHGTDATSNYICSRSNIAVHSILNLADSINNATIQVYPNPMTFNSVVVFPYVSGQKYQLSILDLTGHTVFTKPVNTGETEIDRHNLKEGIYILQIAGKKVLRTKLMVRSIKA